MGERNPPDNDAFVEVRTGSLAFELSNCDFPPLREADANSKKTARTGGKHGCSVRPAACETRSVAPATTLMTPVITTVIVVPGAVSDDRTAESTKRNPSSDPTTAAPGLMNKRLLGLYCLDACEAGIWAWAVP